MIILLVDVDQAVAPPPPPNVKSDCHDGTPLITFRTRLSAPTASLERTLFADAYNMSPFVYVVCPVPPYAIPIDDVDITNPLLAASTPFNPENRLSVPMLAVVALATLNDE